MLWAFCSMLLIDWKSSIFYKFALFIIFITNENWYYPNYQDIFPTIIHDRRIFHFVSATVNGIWSSHGDFRVPLQKTPQPLIRWPFVGVNSYIAVLVHFNNLSCKSLFNLWFFFHYAFLLLKTVILFLTFVIFLSIFMYIS